MGDLIGVKAAPWDKSLKISRERFSGGMGKIAGVVCEPPSNPVKIEPLSDKTEVMSEFIHLPYTYGDKNSRSASRRPRPVLKIRSAEKSQCSPPAPRAEPSQRVPQGAVRRDNKPPRPGRDMARRRRGGVPQKPETQRRLGARCFGERRAGSDNAACLQVGAEIFEGANARRRRRVAGRRIFAVGGRQNFRGGQGGNLYARCAALF